jgi:hypothetical protein
VRIKRVKDLLASVIWMLNKWLPKQEEGGLMSLFA